MGFKQIAELRHLDLLKVQNKGSWCVFSANPDKDGDGDKPYICYQKKYIIKQNRYSHFFN